MCGWMAFPVAARVVGEWLSLVEHLVRDQGVGGSNPLSPTIFSLRGCAHLRSTTWRSRSRTNPGSDGCRRAWWLAYTTLNPLRKTCWSRYSDHLPQRILSSFTTNLSRPSDGSEDSLCLLLSPMSIVLARASLIRNGKLQLCRPLLFRSYNGSGSDRDEN